jgi:hypothetical protein
MGSGEEEDHGEDDGNSQKDTRATDHPWLAVRPSVENAHRKHGPAGNVGESGCEEPFHRRKKGMPSLGKGF